MPSQPLLDDPVFLAELDKLDVAPTVSVFDDRRFVDYARPTIEEWAHEHQLELPAAKPEPPDAPAANRFVAAVTMLGGTLAGAAMAALVFHDPLARIIETLR